MVELDAGLKEKLQAHKEKYGYRSDEFWEGIDQAAQVVAEHYAVGRRPLAQAIIALTNEADELKKQLAAERELTADWRSEALGWEGKHELLEDKFQAASRVVAAAEVHVELWKAQKIAGLPRSERNAALEQTREELIAALDDLVTHDI